MLIVHDYNNAPIEAQNSVIALGNFDGVHKGHREIFKRTIAIAKEKNLKSAIMTFEPHPANILGKAHNNIRITPFESKIKLFEECGIDIAFVIDFTKDFAQISAENFIKEILHDKLKAAHIIIGHDFIFGHNRSGNGKLLSSKSSTYNYKFTQIESIGDSESFSSTRIRNYLKKGNIPAANEILGYDYFIEGEVKKDSQRGRTIGFPTANIFLKDHLRPLFGVYISKVEIDGKTYEAIANIGNKPTVNGQHDLLEVHIFDFSDDIYGQNIKVTPLELVREEKKFNSIEELKKQIEKDCLQAKSYFGA